MVKEECVNHVSKRLGTRLHNFKNDLWRPVTTKTGNVVQRSMLGGQHGLTDANIDKLTLHYGQNIRSHDSTGSVASLRKSIFCTYYHASSTDDEPCHADCPPGPDYWCWVKRAEANGEVPAPHSSKNLYLSKLSLELRKQVFLMYMDLPAVPLLQRCLQKRTQNPNESLHSKLWLKCPNMKNSQLSRVRFAATDTVLRHNFGDARGTLLVRLGLATEAIQENLAAKDAATPSSTHQPKRRRVDSDAGPSGLYVPGAF